MSEATQTAETKKELHRQEIGHLRAAVKELEEQLRESLAVGPGATVPRLWRCS